MIAELTWPGSWLDFPDQDAAFELQSLLHMLTVGLADASLALLLFQSARARDTERHRARFDDRQGSGDRDEAWDAKRQIEDQLLSAADAQGLNTEEQWHLREKIRVEAEILWKRRKWSGGHLPSGLLDREATMHARSFVYSIDGVWKLLGVIDKSPVPNEAGKAKDELKLHLPHLIGVRDTAHHQEDRARGLDRKGKPLNRPPIDNSLVQAPEGGVIMLDSLNGDRYTCTLNDGSLGEVPVNGETLRAVQTAAQQTVGSMQWTGSPMHFPMDF
ncbi:MAG: hypothetical protein GY701_32920 [Sulfitobacter sp.]|nr:hypothetical protein [Sulfitobacter sp.]